MQQKLAYEVQAKSACMEGEGGKTCEEYRRMVGDKVEEVKWKCLDINEHWQQMKSIMT